VPASDPPPDAPARRDAASPTAPAPAPTSAASPTAPAPAGDASSGEASAGSPGAAESVAWTPDAALARSHDAAPAPPSPSLPGDSAPARCNAEAPAMTALTPGDLRARVASSSAQASVPRPHVPAAVRREVWQRDGACCTFVDERGVRCRATAALEFHHEHAHALGGPSTPSNLTLRCRAHNRLAAEVDFGAEHVAARVARARGLGGATP
jgi:5-methylcytosine-specific restriction endonuclease McrA